MEYIFFVPLLGAILAGVGVARLMRDFGLFSLLVGLVVAAMVFVVLWFAVGFYAWDYSMSHPRQPPNA